ncbi:MAG TPA: RNA methyltransferase [Casimicrobiaceae bacterium]|jgi:tRNA/rRNA methyltransferase|nr:RNA methyltransferase [Casimicrobiaceae bacterium]
MTSDATPVEPLSRMRVVLVRTSHPGNIGAAARAMWTMGLDDLVLVAPHRFPDPDASARATGAAHLLLRARVVSALDDALAGCAWTIGASARPREFAGRVLDVRDAAREAMKRSSTGTIAWVFGTEMSGLSNEELARCACVATIPGNPRYASLNLAAAVQVAAYELRMAAGERDVWSAPRFTPATHDAIEGLHAHAARTLAALHFLDPARPRRLMPRLRRLFARAGLEQEEVNILRGILARIDDVLRRTR